MSGVSEVVYMCSGIWEAFFSGRLGTGGPKQQQEAHPRSLDDVVSSPNH